MVMTAPIPGELDGASTVNSIDGREVIAMRSRHRHMLPDATAEIHGGYPFYRRTTRI